MRILKIQDFLSDEDEVGYAVLRPLLPLVRLILPGAVISTEELGRAMIRAAREGATKRVLENRDLIALGAA